jgi:hypothetical protein
VLQKTISAIRPETWEAINRVLLSNSRQAKLEDRAVVRLDWTVTSALMHGPSDSSPGGLSSDAFFAGTAAHDSSDHIIYNSSTGALLRQRRDRRRGSNTILSLQVCRLRQPHSL